MGGGLKEPAARFVDALVFSSAWVGVAAMTLCLVAGAALGAELPRDASGWIGPALAFCGTLVVYNVDRLRDLARDRTSTPARSAFVERHPRGLMALTVAAGALSAALAVLAGPAVAVLLAPVLLAGFFHRRLKRFGGWKPFYVSAAWTGVVVGLPALRLPSPRHVGWVAALVGSTVMANAIASNLRDGEASSARLGAGVPLRLARSSAALALLIGAFAPSPVRPLVCIPLATLAALAFFRADERYGLVVVDGALWAGALLALPWYVA